MNDFIWQCVLFLMQYDLTYTVLAAIAILVVLWVIRFIIALMEDNDEGNG